MPDSHKTPDEALLAAAERGWLALAEDATRRGADLGARNALDQTPLLLAALSGNAQLVEWLLARSDAQAVDCSKETALIAAARGGHGACVVALLPASDPLAADANGATALMHSLASGSQAAFFCLLGVSDPFLARADGATSLFLAAEYGREWGMKALLPLSDPFVVNARGEHLLLAAARSGSLGCAKLALPFCDPEKAGARGQTATGVALARRHWPVADWLATNSPSAATRAVMADADLAMLPLWRSFLEKEELLAAVDEAGERLAAEGFLGCGEGFPARPPRRV